MRKEMLALLGFLRRQVGLRTDAASPTGSTHAKLANIAAKIGTAPYDVMAYGSVASNTLRASSDTSKSSTSTDIIKLKEIQVFAKGSVRVSYEASRGSSIGCVVYLYVNGAATGFRPSITTTYTTYTTDITVREGDAIQLYMDNSADSGGTVRNFRLYWDYFVGASNVTLN